MQDKIVRHTYRIKKDKKGQDTARQDKTSRDKTRQDKTRQDKTRQDKTRQDETRQDKTRQDKKKTPALAVFSFSSDECGSSPTHKRLSASRQRLASLLTKYKDKTKKHKKTQYITK